MHFRRWIVACVVILPCCFFSFGQMARFPMSIDDVVKTALDTNREYMAAKERLAEARALVRQAGLRPTPAIEVEASSGAILGNPGESEYSAGYFHTFETAGKREKRIAAAQIGLLLAEAEVQERQRLLVSEVKRRFIAAASERLKLDSVQALLPASEESYRLTARRVELGDAVPLEEQLLFAESNRVRAQHAVLAGASDAATMRLKAAVGLSSEEPLEIAPALTFAQRDLTLAQLQQQALNRRPDLRIVRLLEEQAAAETAVAQAERRPDVTASVAYTQSHSRFDQFGLSESGAIVPLRDSDNTVRFGLSIPIFTRKRAEAATATALSREAQQRLRNEYLMRAIPQEVEAAYRQWSAAIRALQILRAGVLEPSQKNLTVIREAYRLGQLRLYDVLNEQRRLADLQLSFVDAQAEAARALVELESAAGGNLP
jgi:cobalt-zinc-cadmium efflux system outer membrane protein